MICDKTTLWAFDTKLAQVATNTTLGTATRHDFAAITIHTPEAPTAGFAIKSAIVVLSIRDAFTTPTDFDGVRIGIKLGAVAFDDVDYTLTLANTGDHETLTMQRDVTAYFVSNFGTGASQSCQVGVAVATGAAANVNNITCELLLTYDYDNAAATHCKSVEFLIQGDINNSTTTYGVEIGTGGTSPAPANQIPQLTGAGGKLPEAGITIRQCYLRLLAYDGSNATTDLGLTIKIDAGGADAVRATLEEALQSDATFRDIVDLLAYGMSTTAAHALFAKSSVALAFDGLCAVLVVTYTFTTSGTTRELHSLRVPIDQERGDQINALNLTTTAADDDRQTATLIVPEPGTITMLQSGVLFWDQRTGAATGTLTTYAPGQAERVNNLRATPKTGNGFVARRCDHDSSTWALARGKNRLPINMRIGSVSPPVMPQMTGIAFVCYTADVPVDGVGSGNRSVVYDIGDHQSEVSGGLMATALRVPSFPSSPWRLATSPAVLFGPRAIFTTSTIGSFGAERGAGEDAEDGWVASHADMNTRTESTRVEIVLVADWFRRSSYATLGLSLTASRRWRSYFSVAQCWYAQLWITHSTMRFTVSGTIVGASGAPVANGKIVKVFAEDAEGTIEQIASVVTTGGTGAFTATVPDNVRTYWATYNNDGLVGRSQLGTPT